MLLIRLVRGVNRYLAKLFTIANVLAIIPVGMLGFALTYRVADRICFDTWAAMGFGLGGGFFAIVAINGFASLFVGMLVRLNVLADGGEYTRPSNTTAQPPHARTETHEAGDDVNSGINEGKTSLVTTTFVKTLPHSEASDSDRAEYAEYAARELKKIRGLGLAGNDGSDREFNQGEVRRLLDGEISVKTGNPSWQLYVTSILMYRLREMWPAVKGECEVRVQLEDGVSHLDLFFPAIDVYLEVDEYQHKGREQMKRDSDRMESIAEALKGQGHKNLVEVRFPLGRTFDDDVRGNLLGDNAAYDDKTVEDISDDQLEGQIDMLVDYLKERCMDMTKKSPSLSENLAIIRDGKPHSVEGFNHQLKIGDLKIGDKIVYENSPDPMRFYHVLNGLFETEYGGWQRGSWLWTTPSGEDKIVWFPDFKHEIWKNELDGDGKIITMRRRRDRQKIALDPRDPDDKPLTRVVFGRNPPGEEDGAIVYLGEFVPEMLDDEWKFVRVQHDESPSRRKSKPKERIRKRLIASNFVAGELRRSGHVPEILINGDIVCKDFEDRRVYIMVRHYDPDKGSEVILGPKTIATGERLMANLGEKIFWVLAGIPAGDAGQSASNQYHIIPSGDMEGWNKPSAKEADAVPLPDDEKYKNRWEKLGLMAAG